MVTVTVRHQDKIDLAKSAEVFQRLGSFGILGDEWIDDDDLAGWCGNFESSLTVLLQGPGLTGHNLCHCKRQQDDGQQRTPDPISKRHNILRFNNRFLG